VLGYEAQLVNAVISSSNAIVGRFHYEYEGDWSKCATSREEIKKPAKGGVRRKKGARLDQCESGVGSARSFADEITWGEPVFLSSIITRNSPLWKNPKQQIAYLAVKYWARLYCPESFLACTARMKLSRVLKRKLTRLRSA
jgi:hypothetical protein